MAARLDEPAFADALRELAPTAVRSFNATEYMAAMRGQPAGPCFERPTPPRGVKLSKGDMPCCHFSHRGPELWGAQQCLQMVEVRLHRARPRPRVSCRAQAARASGARASGARDLA
jgi:hypothetical protein